MIFLKLPNLLFYGPPGTGKTSLILALARQLFGFAKILFSNTSRRPLYSDRVLELNASDERGINVIREKVKNFSKLAVSGSVEGASGSASPPPYKLVVLDEADSMTAPAQVCDPSPPICCLGCSPASHGDRREEHAVLFDLQLRDSNYRSNHQSLR